MTHRSIGFAIAALVAIAVLASGLTSSPANPPQAVLPDTALITAAMVASGRSVFHGAGNCFTCHGADLEGTPIAPTLRKHAWKDAKGGSLAEIYRVVTHGVDGTAMVSHPNGITDAQAVNAAVYVWSVSQGKAKP